MMSHRIVESESCFENDRPPIVHNQEANQSSLSESTSCYVSSREVVESGTSAITHPYNSRNMTTNAVVHDATKSMRSRVCDDAVTDGIADENGASPSKVIHDSGTSENSKHYSNVSGGETDSFKLLESALRTIENGKSEQIEPLKQQEKYSSRFVSSNGTVMKESGSSNLIRNSSLNDNFVTDSSHCSSAPRIADCETSKDYSADKIDRVADRVSDFGSSDSDKVDISDAKKQSTGCGPDSGTERVITIRPRVAEMGSTNTKNSEDSPEERRPFGRKMCAYQLSRAAVVDEGCSNDPSLKSPQHNKDSGGSVKTKETGCGSDVSDVNSIISETVSDSIIEKSGKVSSGISCSIDPTSLDLEYKIARFVENVDIAEYRFTGKMSPIQRNNIKRIADERDLIHRVLGKGKDKCIALRKKARFHYHQKIAKELNEETKRMREAKKANELARSQDESKVSNGVCSSGCGPDDSDFPFKKPKGIEICIQTDEDPQEPVKRQIKEKPVKIDSTTQTCPEFYYVCMYCEKDIPEAIKSFHHVQCLREWKTRRAATRLEEERLRQLRIQEEEARVNKYRPSGTPQEQARRLLAKENARIASKKTKQKKSKSDEAIKKTRSPKISVKSDDNPSTNDPFENIHDNDINGLLSAVRRLDTAQNKVSDDNGNPVSDENSVGNDKGGITGYEKARLKKHLRERLTILAEKRK